MKTLKERGIIMAGNLPAGFFNGFDIQGYRALIGAAPAGSVLVECGSYRGRSLCSIASQLRARGMNAIAADTCDWSLPRHADLPSVEEDLRENLRRWGLSDIVEVRVGDCHAIATPAGLGAVFLDDDHRFEHVLRAIYRWWPDLPTGGVIGGHDYIVGILELPFLEVVAAITRAFGGRENVRRPHKRGSVWMVKKLPDVELTPEPSWLAAVAHEDFRDAHSRGAVATGARVEAREQGALRL